MTSGDYRELKHDLRHYFVDIEEVGVRRVARRNCSLVALSSVSYLRSEQDVVLNSLMFIIFTFTGSQCHDNLDFDMILIPHVTPIQEKRKHRLAPREPPRHRSLMGGTAQKSPQPLSCPEAAESVFNTVP